MRRTVKNLCLSALCMTMFMAIYPDKASAYSCGSEDDGYVCCNSYHTFGHGNYLTIHRKQQLIILLILGIHNYLLTPVPYFI